MGNEVDYGFDIFFDAGSGDSKRKQFLWRSIGTFKSDTHPEYAYFDSFGCNPNSSGFCNYFPPCTGLRVTTPPYFQPPNFERVAPCSCCTCWYQIFNEIPVLSDNLYSTSNAFSNIKIDRIPLNGWIFMYKIYYEVEQLTLSDGAFRFYKSIRAQQEAVDDLFQPISGKIPTNLKQVSGSEYPIYGYFYSAGLSKRTMEINRADVPAGIEIPSTSGTGGDALVCLDLFPNSTTAKPDFWVD